MEGGRAPSKWECEWARRRASVGLLVVVKKRKRAPKYSLPSVLLKLELALLRGVR